MSVQSEITRLENAKAAIKAAIENKGVTVPDATLLDGMAALIESIEAGGGGIKFTTGVFVPSVDTKDALIEHGMGVAPDIVIYFSESLCSTTSGNFGMLFGQNSRKGLLSSSPYASSFGKDSSGYFYWDTTRSKGYLDTQSDDQYSYYTNGAPYKADETSFRLMQEKDKYHFLFAGCAYRWYAIGGLS